MRYLFVLFVSISVVSFNGCKTTPKGGRAAALNAMSAQKITATYIDASVKQAQNYPDEALKGYETVLQLAPAHHAAMFNLAKIYMEKGQNEQALKYAEKALKLDPTNSWYYNLTAVLYEKNNRISDAASTLEGAVPRFPKDVDLKIQLSDYYLKLQKYNEALKVYDEIENTTGMIEMMARQKKEVYLFLNKPEKAIAELRRLVDLFPDKPEYYYDLFNLYVQLRRNEDALKTLQELNAKNPDDSFALFRLIDFYIANGDKQRADELLEKAFNNPNLDSDAKVQFLARRIAFDPNAHQKPEIKRMLDKLYKENPKVSVVLALKAQLALSGAKPDSARYFLRQAVRMDETNQRLWEQLLAVDLQIDKPDTLLVDAQAALEVYPNLLYYNYMHGLAYYQKKNYQQATRIFEKCTLMQSDNRGLTSDVYMLLGDCYHHQNDYARSDKSFNKSINFNPDNYTALNNFAYFLSVRGEKLDTALIYIEKVIKVYPDNASYQDTYGWILYKKGKFNDARDWIEKAYKQGASADVAEHLGDVYYQLGDVQKAKQYWLEARNKGLNNESINRKINTGKL